MSNTLILRFIGTRQRDFTVTGPVTGEAYYVKASEPGYIVTVNTDDANALTERDPHLWERYEYVMDAAEAPTLADITAPEFPAVVRASRSSQKPKG